MNIDKTVEYFNGDYSHTLFPLRSTKVLVDTHAKELLDYVYDDILKGTGLSFLPQTRCHASKHAFTFAVPSSWIRWQSFSYMTSSSRTDRSIDLTSTPRDVASDTDFLKVTRYLPRRATLNSRRALRQRGQSISSRSSSMSLHILTPCISTIFGVARQLGG